MADEVGSGSNTGRRPEAGEVEECEPYSITSSETSCALEGDGVEDVVEGYL